MRLHRFFVDEKINRTQEVRFPDGDSRVRQFSKVFRFQPGNQVILLDNSGDEFVAQIVHMSKQEVKLQVVEQRRNMYRPKREMYLCISLLKKDNVEWILQKGTELGVMHFVPLISERVEKKNLNIERAQTIIKEAAEQSGKTVLPTLHEMCTLSDAIKNFSVPSFVLDFNGKHFHQNNFAEGNAVAVYVGPEGGWSENDRKIFEEHHISKVSLGDAILRAETAAISISALLLV